MAKIVEAVGSASFTASPGTKSKARSKAVEDAMTEAIKQAYAEGAIEPEEIKARMMAAREKVKISG
jgi:hypothetical protein